MDVNDGYSYTEIELSITRDMEFSKNPTEDTKLDKFFECAMSNLSFQLTETLWIENTGMSSNSTTDSYIITINFEPLSDELFPLLYEKFFERVCCVNKKDVTFFEISNHYNFPRS